MEIEGLDVIGQGDEPMCEPSRDVKHRAVVFRQFDPEPFEIGRGAGAQIDDHVPERSPDRPHDLHFRRGRAAGSAGLARRPFQGQRIIGRHEAALGTRRSELLFAKSWRRSRMVATLVELDPVAALKPRLVELRGYRLLRRENASANADPHRDRPRPCGARAS